MPSQEFIEKLSYLQRPDGNPIHPNLAENVGKGIWTMYGITRLGYNAPDLKKELQGGHVLPPVFFVFGREHAPQADAYHPVELTLVEMDPDERYDEAGNKNPSQVKKTFHGRTFQSWIEFTDQNNQRTSYNLGWFALPGAKDVGFVYKNLHWCPHPDAPRNEWLPLDFSKKGMISGLVIHAGQLTPGNTPDDYRLKASVFPYLMSPDYVRHFDPKTGRLILPKENQSASARQRAPEPPVHPDVPSELLAILSDPGRHYQANVLTVLDGTVMAPIPLIVVSDKSYRIETGGNPGSGDTQIIIQAEDDSFRVVGSVRTYLGGPTILDIWNLETKFIQNPQQESTQVVLIDPNNIKTPASVIALPIPTRQLDLYRFQEYLENIRSQAAGGQRMPRTGTVFEASVQTGNAEVTPELTMPELRQHIESLPLGSLVEGFQEWHGEIALPARSGKKIRYPVKVKTDKNFENIGLTVMHVPLSGRVGERTSLRQILNSIVPGNTHLLHSVSVRLENGQIQITSRRTIRDPQTGRTTYEDTDLKPLQGDAELVKSLIMSVETPEALINTSKSPARKTPGVAKADQVKKKGKPRRHW